MSPRRAPTRPISRKPATRASSATAIIRTTSISSSPRRRWRATCRPRSREARKLAANPRADEQSQIAWVQAINAAPYFAAAQFAAPAQILAMTAPDRAAPLVKAMRHYARGVAYAKLRNAPVSTASSRRMRGPRRPAFQADDRPGRARGRRCSRWPRRGAGRFAYATGRYRTRPLAFSATRSRSKPRSHTWSRPSGIIRCTNRLARRCPLGPLRRGARGVPGGTRPVAQQRLGAVRPGGVGAVARTAVAGGGGPGRARQGVDGQPGPAAGWSGSRR